jgi:hypothetical protein
LNYIAQVDPLVEQFAKPLKFELPPVKAKAENIFSSFGALQTGQLSSKPSAPML